MTIQIKVPALGESVTEATVAKWFKKVGDQVNADVRAILVEDRMIAMEGEA